MSSARSKPGRILDLNVYKFLSLCERLTEYSRNSSYSQWSIQLSLSQNRLYDLNIIMINKCLQYILNRLY